MTDTDSDWNYEELSSVPDEYDNRNCCIDDWADWLKFETWIWVALLLVQLSMVAFLVIHGRKDKSFRQAFFIFFVAVTLVDCALALLRTSHEHEKTVFGTIYDRPYIVQEDPQTHEMQSYPTIRGTINKIVFLAFVPVLGHAQQLFLTAIAATRFTAFAFALKHASMWRTRTVVVVAVSLAVLSVLLGAVYPIAVAIRLAEKCALPNITQSTGIDCGWEASWFHGQFIIPNALVTVTSAICCIVCFVLNIGSITMLTVLRATGRLQRKGPELALFVHSLCMFLLQSSLAFQDIIYVADNPENINWDLVIWDLEFELTLADYRHSTEWLAGANATRTWYKNPDGIRRMILSPGCSPWAGDDFRPICPVWYRLLIGELRVREDPGGPDQLTLHTLEQYLIALSGSIFLLIIRNRLLVSVTALRYYFLSGNVRNAYFKFYFKWQCLKKTRGQKSTDRVFTRTARRAPPATERTPPIASST